MPNLYLIVVLWLYVSARAGALLSITQSIRYAPLMTVTVRFAPSPTGRIHIGNARTALFNWLFAMNNKGRFIQRFDDTDIARSRQEFSDAILYDLHWLGIFPDATEYQSRRFEIYDAAVERLKAAGVLYACYETPEELDLRRKVRRTRGLPPVYGREALTLTHAADRRIPVRRPPAALALPAAQFHRRSAAAGTHRSPLERSGARRGNRRSCLAFRPGSGARGRHLSLHAAFGRRRHRDGRQPCHPRRRPCHQHRRADRPVQGAGRRAAGVRPPQSLDHGLGRGAVEAHRRAVDRKPARGSASSRWRSLRWPCWSAPRRMSRRCRRWPNLPSASIRPRRRNPPPSSIRTSCSCSTARCCTICRSPRRATG